MEGNAAIEAWRKTLEAELGGTIPKSHRDPVERLAVALTKCHDDVVIAALSTGWGVTRALAVTKSQLHVATARKDEVQIIDLEDIEDIRTRLGDLKLVTRAGAIKVGSLSPDGRNYEVASTIRSLKSGEDIRAVSPESLEATEREISDRLGSAVPKGHEHVVRRLAWLLASRRTPSVLVGVADPSTAIALTDSLICVVPKMAEPQIIRFDEASDTTRRGSELTINRAHDSQLVIRGIKPVGRARELVRFLRQATTDPSIHEARRALYEALCNLIEVRQRDAATPRVDSALSKSSPSNTPRATPPAKKRCPQCAEEVMAAAKVCRYCGYEWLKWWQQSKEQKSRHPASCCGCSCGTVIAAMSVAVGIMLALTSLSAVAAIGVGGSVALAAVNASNFAMGGRLRRGQGENRPT